VDEMKQGRGWRNESHRHRLAGMGIKTSQEIQWSEVCDFLDYSNPRDMIFST